MKFMVVKPGSKCKYQESEAEFCPQGKNLIQFNFSDNGGFLESFTEYVTVVLPGANARF